MSVVEGCVLNNVMAVRNISLRFLVLGSVPDSVLVEYSVTESFFFVFGNVSENVHVRGQYSGSGQCLGHCSGCRQWQ